MGGWVHIGGSQWITMKFVLFLHYVGLGMESGVSVLAASLISHWAILPVHFFLFMCKAAAIISSQDAFHSGCSCLHYFLVILIFMLSSSLTHSVFNVLLTFHIFALSNFPLLFIYFKSHTLEFKHRLNKVSLLADDMKCT